MGEVTPPLEHLHPFMKAESDFYNVISMCELAGLFIDTFLALSIVWVQIAYHKICNDEFNGVASQLVNSQVKEVMAATNLSEEDRNRRIELINLRYQISYNVLGRRHMLLSHAMTYFLLRRPSRKTLTNKQSVLDDSGKNESVRDALVNRSTFLSSTVNNSQSLGNLTEHLGDQAKDSTPNALY